MRIVMFYHSLISDWNHGNAHFLRGVVTELLARGHDVCVYEPARGWSLTHLLREHGLAAVAAFRDAYPNLRSTPYEPDELDLEQALDGADLVLIHEWNPPELVRAAGEARARQRSFRLLFHDTHHRTVSAEHEIVASDLRHYDGVLAFGRALKALYLERGLTERAWVWHEAADTRVFAPAQADPASRADLVWIGNWGDGERSAELQEFLLDPIAELRLSANLFGVRYPPEALQAVERAGAHYRGWLANFDAPLQYSRHRVTVHVPRRYYAQLLPGIPTIRVFEALACGIPLICAPWRDDEGLFEPGRDYLVARDGAEMKRRLRAVLEDVALSRELAEHGRRTIETRHTCAHRADELIAIAHELGGV